MKVYVVVQHDNTEDRDLVELEVFTSKEQAKNRFNQKIADYCQQEDMLAPSYCEADYAVFDDTYGNVYEVWIQEKIAN